MRRTPISLASPFAGLLVLLAILSSAGQAVALSSGAGGGSGIDGPFTLALSSRDFARAELVPEFSRVVDFDFEIDLAGPLLPGAKYTNLDVTEVRYLVRGRLNTDPPTPSGFPAFALNRFASGEGVISAREWIDQGSRLGFQIRSSAFLGDGLQLSELKSMGGEEEAILEIDAREFERLDRARYHPPQLSLFLDGTGLLRNSNNSSGKTGITNPATGLEVDVDFGEEYVTRIAFDPSGITVIDAPIGEPVPEPGTALLIGLGLAGLATSRRCSL